jgi:hypothetical protein
MKNEFFKYLNYILKTDKKKPENLHFSSYMINRWLSMTSKPIAKIVNSTTNRWNTSDYEFLTDFLIKILPKHSKRIEYIKKTPKDIEETSENVEFLSNCLELSRKELEMYQKTLEELNLTHK